MEHSKVVVILLVIAIFCLVVTVTLLVSINTIDLKPLTPQSTSDSNPGGNVQLVVLPQENTSGQQDGDLP